MNNEQSQRLLDMAYPGRLVTILNSNGSTTTGRAYTTAEGLFIKTADGFIRAVTAHNIIEVKAS